MPKLARPFVTANFALTWDGRISTRRGTPSDFSSKKDKHRLVEIRAQCDAVLITRGEQGMWLSDAHGDAAIPAVAREVSDVTGAGDTVVATLALALAAGATMTEAATLANHAAGIVVGKFGPATVSPEELLSRFGIQNGV